MQAHAAAAALLTAVSGLAYDTPNDTTSHERLPNGGRRGTAVRECGQKTPESGCLQAFIAASNKPQRR